MPRPIGLATLLLATLCGPASAAEPARLVPEGRFLARCEDLGQFCFVESCGRDQIEAALGCRRVCPSSVVMTVTPLRCPLPAETVLRARG